MARFKSSDYWRVNMLILSGREGDIKKLLKQFPSLKSENQDYLKTSNNVYFLTPTKIEVEAPMLIQNELVYHLTDPKPQQELVEDFEDSADIYNYLAKSNMRIIEDSFSYTRNHRLYSAFYQLESMLRLRLLSSNQFHKSRPIRDYTKTLKLDHRVSMFTFSELYETLLLSPASDEYVLSKWEETDKKGTTLLELSKNLKGLDELNFPLTASELKFLLNQRNQCMHFRVTTLDEYSRTIRLVNKYILSRQSKKLNDIVAKNIASMQETMAKVDTSALNTLLGIHSEAAQSITKSILAASKPMTDLQETIAKLRGPLNEMAENALKTAVPMQRAARAAAKLRPLDTDQNSKPKNKP